MSSKIWQPHWHGGERFGLTEREAFSHQGLSVVGELTPYHSTRVLRVNARCKVKRQLKPVELLKNPRDIERHERVSRQSSGTPPVHRSLETAYFPP